MIRNSQGWETILILRPYGDFSCLLCKRTFLALFDMPPYEDHFHGE